eukprot:tig00000405_g497.t1
MTSLPALNQRPLTPLSSVPEGHTRRGSAASHASQAGPASSEARKNSRQVKENQALLDIWTYEEAGAHGGGGAQDRTIVKARYLSAAADEERAEREGDGERPGGPGVVVPPIPPALAGSDFLSLAYASARKSDPRAYPKKAVTEAALRERLAQLEGQPARLEILVRDLQHEADMKKRDQRRQMREVGKKAHPVALYGKEKLEIRLMGRRTEPATFTVFKKPTVEHSEYIRRRVDDITAGTAVGSDHHPSIAITDIGDHFGGHDCCDCFDAPNFNRFVLFSKHPDAVAAEAKLASHVEEVKQGHVRTREQLLRELEEEQSARLARLQAEREKEWEGRKEELEAKFEARIRHIREEHARMVEAEKENVASAFNDREDDAAGAFALERSRLLEVCDKVLEAERKEAELEWREAKDLKQKIFPARKLPSLCILASAIRAEPLRLQCVELMAGDPRQFDQHLMAREFRSPLMQESVADLLSRLPLHRVVWLRDEGWKTHCFDPGALAHEVELRRKVLDNQFKKTARVELDAMLSAPPNPANPLDRVTRETIKSELARRVASTRPHIRLLLPPPTAPPGVAIDRESRLIAAAQVPLRYVTAWASHTFELGTMGKWYFEVEILHLDSFSGSTLSVGFDVPRAPGERHSRTLRPGITPGSGGEYGCAIQNDGNVHWQGRSHFAGTPFAKEDIVGVLLNQDDRTVSFFRRGNKAACVGAPDPVLARGDFPVEQKYYKLVPCVCFYSIRSPKEPSVVRFNFKGPFAYAHRARSGSEVPYDADPAGGDPKPKMRIGIGTGADTGAPAERGSGDEGDEDEEENGAEAGAGGAPAGAAAPGANEPREREGSLVGAVS